MCVRLWLMAAQLNSSFWGCLTACSPNRKETRFKGRRSLSNSWLEYHRGLYPSFYILLSEYISFECKSSVYYSHMVPIFEDVSVGFVGAGTWELSFSRPSFHAKAPRTFKIFNIPDGSSRADHEFLDGRIARWICIDVNSQNQVACGVIVGDSSQLHDHSQSAFPIACLQSKQ